MLRKNRLEVIDPDGWQKDFMIEQAIVYIGTAEDNDLILQGGEGRGVSPHHLHLIPSATNSQEARLINLGETEVTIYPYKDESLKVQTLQPRDSVDIQDGDRVQVGDFALIFAGAASATNMKLGISLPDTPLTLENPLRGVATIHHMGDKTGVRFLLNIEGLPPDCWEIEPGAALFPNAERQVPFRLLHPRKPYPPAGDHRILFHVTAPEVYAGEVVSVEQDIYIAPFYQHTLRILDDSP